jgi:ubiquinone/menaquinone biosynthesis C-methylase UbiE
MDDSEISTRMREDWNARAREDAGYYSAFGRRDQDDAGFFATATEVINALEAELRRVPVAERVGWKALEIGCGPGRLMRPMSRHFVEIHGVDVSDEMIGLAREKLRDVPNAYPHVTSGASLGEFADDSFDFVYSYAVFQHIPSRDVVFQYLREIRRVLKTGGLARLQFNGLPRGGESRGESNDTWAGARFSSSDILEFTEAQAFQVLALEGVSTQYLSTTWRKRPQGWHARQLDQLDEAGSAEPSDSKTAPRIHHITNASSKEPVAPCRGRFASIFIWMENLPPEAGLHDLRVVVGDSFATLTCIGPPDRYGLQPLAVLLPELEATGLLPVEIRRLGRALAPPATLRIIPPGPSVPQVRSIRDGVNRLAENRIETRIVRMTLEEIARPHEIEAAVGGHPVADLEFFCIDPRPQVFEVYFRLPEEVAPGRHLLEVRVGRRKLAPVMLDVVS